MLINLRTYYPGLRIGGVHARAVRPQQFPVDHQEHASFGRCRFILSLYILEKYQLEAGCCRNWAFAVIKMVFRNVRNT